ncbi:Protein of unknown function [Paramicrobacterium humi]|uniref:DUF3093 domain-containing protein n=1 Tax=Paramicrobacterium humi TaxID=640635 RepID=A0A1H4QLB5_9MICO|nr:DUF3093 domain-containing protein [Microbacterium humi]SEC20374.1 Protein of unknown function [Microbacterium humi]
MSTYHERVWPAVWVLVASVLVIPASLMVFAPISVLAGVITGVALYAGCVGLWVLSTRTIEIVDDELRAGRARIPVSFVGEAVALSGHEAFAARGAELDARAWLLIRGGVPDVVRVPLTDPDDPTPYWLLSSRHAKKLAAAINESRRPASRVDKS